VYFLGRWPPEVLPSFWPSEKKKKGPAAEGEKTMDQSNGADREVIPDSTGDQEKGFERKPIIQKNREKKCLNGIPYTQGGVHTGEAQGEKGEDRLIQGGGGVGEFVPIPGKEGKKKLHQ